MIEVKLLFVILFVYLGDSTSAFVCQEKGLFANTDSNDCSTFISCDSNLNSKVISCGSNLYFWPEKRGCYDEYNCATQSMPDNTDPCEGFNWYEQIPDKNSADCSAFIQCSRIWEVYDSDIEDYMFIRSLKHKQCPLGSVFRYRHGCVSASSYTCTNYQCPGEGYFANPDTNDCSTFIDCKKLSTTATLVSPFLKTCPLNTKFSPFTKKCDEFYNCDGNDPHNGIDPCSTYNWARPFVPNPQSNDCSTYLECHQGTHYDDRMDVIVKKTCSGTTKFSPIVGKCYYNYDCNRSCSKDPCSNGVGSFVDFESGQCRNFVECRDTSQDEMIYEPVYEKVYCPPGALFSPEISSCDIDYICPKFAVNYCYPEIPTTPPPTTTTTTAAAA